MGRRAVIAEQANLDALDAHLVGLAGAEGRDVVLIVLDTLRADRLELMPRLQAWAEGARRYPNMRSVGSWTLPAHASLFTGRHPREHGAHGSADYEWRARGLDETWPTLAERLSEQGYATVGIAANVAFLDRRWGLARGFDLWLCEQLPGGRPRLPYHQGDRVVDLAVHTLEQVEGSLFLFVNLMEPHSPWNARQGYTEGGVDPATLPGERERFAELRRDLLGHQRSDPVAVESWRSAYDAETRWLDEQLERLLRAVDEDAVVVVLSDHGEFLGEHDLVEHSKALYDEVLRVPLFVRGPAPGEDLSNVQTDDVPDLVLEVLGLPPLGQVEDLQVAELHGGRARDLRWPRIWERTDRRLRAFGEGPWLVIEDLDSGAVESFYEGAVTEDGGEELLQRGHAWVEATPAWAGEWEAEIDLEALQALGYADP